MLNLTDKQYKISLLGDGAVGKTSLRRNYLGETFKANYNMTLGADFATNYLTIDDMKITMVIWDLAGQPRFNVVREVYYRGTKGALLVFDLSRPESYESLANWVAELYKNNRMQKVPIVLIGNKADLRGSDYNTIPAKYGEDYAKRLSEWSGYDVPYIETSAKLGNNVVKSFETLVRQIIKQSQVSFVKRPLRREN
ncbi:MAG: GTP-binding protein [Candidatus Thorarchaeota archaeon]